AFNAIARISPNSEVDTQVMSFCIRSKSSVLYDAAVDRTYNHPVYAPGTNLIPLIVTSISHGEHTNQWRAIRALRHIGRDSNLAIMALRQNLHAALSANRREAAKALLQAKALSDAYIIDIGRLLFDEDEEVRASAVFVLDRVGTNALPAL